MSRPKAIPGAGHRRYGRIAKQHASSGERGWRPEFRHRVMGVVKADAYGHGLIPAALAALAGGATWLGTAQSHEALLLRKAGIGPDRCHILTWVYNGMAVPFDELIDNDIDISVGSLPGIDGVAAAARRLGKPHACM